MGLYEGLKQISKDWLVSWTPTVLLPIKYVVADVKRNQRAFFIGSTTVFLLVTFIAVLQNSTSKSPSIFLKLSENQVGEYDLFITPVGSSGNSRNRTGSQSSNTLNNEINNYLVNQTRIENSLHKSKLATGSVARWIMIGDAEAQDPSRAVKPTASVLSSTILFIDTFVERKYKLGRQWQRRALEADECYASESMLRSIGVPPARGMKLTLSINLNRTIQSLGITNDQIDNFVQNLTDTIQNNQNSTGSNLNFTIIIPPIPGLNTTGFNATFDGGSVNSTFISSIIQDFKIQFNFTVVEQISDPQGKYPVSLGNVVVLESKYLGYFIQYAFIQLVNQIVIAVSEANGIPFAGDLISPPTSFQNLTNIQFTDYAFLASVQYKDRIRSYVKSSDGLDQDMIKFTNDVSEAIGVDFPGSFSLPLVSYLTLTSFVRLFLDQIFADAVVLLSLLGCGLIFSLMISDVSEKTFEYGMLRTLGMKSQNLIHVMITQALFFAIPGVILGLLVAYFFNIPLSNVIAGYSYEHVVLTFTPSALGVPIVLGILIPLLSNVIPTSRSLSKSLRDALDIYHQSFNETTVKMVKLEDLGLSGWQTASAIIMVIMGFVVYYLMPLSFTFGNLTMFFSLLNAILLGMVLGFALISQTLQPILERYLVFLIVWGKDRRLINLIHKNQSSHGERNIKTGLMFTIALSFIIFAGAMFTLQTNAIVDNVKLLLGADIAVISRGPETALDEVALREFLHTQKGGPELPHQYSHELINLVASYGLDELLNVSSTTIGNLVDYSSFSIPLAAVDRNYLDAVYDEYYIPSEISNKFNYKMVQGKEDVIKSLYDDAGKATLPIDPPRGSSIPDMISSIGGSSQRYSQGNTYVYQNYLDIAFAEGLKELLSVDLNSPLKIEVELRHNMTLVYLCKPRAVLRKIPGYFFSSYRQLAPASRVLINMDQYYMIMRDIQKAYNHMGVMVDIPEKVPKQKVLVRMRKDASSTDREVIVNGIRNLLQNDTISVTDTMNFVATTTSATGFIMLFFNIVAMIAIALCFFMLWLSFTANMKENFWEFGVLRSIGLRFTGVLRAYIYEAMCLLTSSVLLACIIGIIIAITLTLQFNLFTELPFRFSFPSALFASVVITSYAVAILGSYIPATSLREKQIALVLRGVE